MILRFLSLDFAMSKVMLFLLIFSRFFLITFFFARQVFFTHFLYKYLESYQYLSCVASSVPSNFFHSWHGGKILGNSKYWAKIKTIGGWRSKIKIIGGMEAKYWGGGCIPPSPRDLQPCIQCVYYILLSNTHLS